MTALRSVNLTSLTDSEEATFLPFSEGIRLTIASFKKLAYCCDSAMTSYEHMHLLSEKECEFLRCCPSVLELPSRDEITPPSSFSEIARHLQKDSYDISVFFVYLQHTQEQQMTHEDDLLKCELEYIKRAFLCIIYRLETMLRQQRMATRNSADESAMPSRLKFFKNTKARYWRDFLLLRDAKLFVEAMVNDYNTFMYYTGDEDEADGCISRQVTKKMFITLNPTSLKASEKTTFLPLLEGMKLTISSFKALGTCCVSAMTSYEHMRLLTEEESEFLHICPSVLGLPRRDDIPLPSSFTEIVQHLQKDVYDISVFLIYLQHTQEQQMTHDGELLKCELENIEHAIISIISGLKTMLRQQGMSTRDSADESAMPTRLKFIKSTKVRYWRDYLLLRDAKLFVDTSVIMTHFCTELETKIERIFGAV